MCRNCGWLYYMKLCPECKQNYYCNNCFAKVGGCNKCAQTKCIQCKTNNTIKKCVSCSNNFCSVCIEGNVCMLCKLGEGLQF